MEQYFQAYLATLPADHPHRTAGWMAEAWGDSPRLADELGRLIASGVKTATCSSLWESEAAGESPVEPGFLTVVLDGKGQPLCIIETVEVTVRRFDEVDAAFAFEEGEDDRSLASWRVEHERFFTRILEGTGRAFTEAMPLVCERFRRVSPSF